MDNRFEASSGKLQKILLSSIINLMLLYYFKLCGQKVRVNSSEIPVNSLNYDEFVENFERTASFNDQSSTASFLTDAQIDWSHELNILRSLIVPNITVDEVSDVSSHERWIRIKIASFSFFCLLVGVTKKKF